MRHPFCLVLLFLLPVFSGAAQMETPGANSYSPLAVSSATPATVLRIDVVDQRRTRTIPLKIFLPAEEKSAPVILFSHGLGGSREGNAYLGKHWAARGYAVVFLQHPGSDAAIWEDQTTRRARRQALENAVSAENLQLRAEDVPAVLNQLAVWQKQKGHPLFGRIDVTRTGMAGHSFGAVTTQAVSGQRFPGKKTGWTDPRIRAAIALSPSQPRTGNASTAFGEVRIPWLLMTGTADVAEVGGISLADRLAVFPALPPGNKYELVLQGAIHADFTDSTVRQITRNPRYHRAILAISTAFWDATLKNDPLAGQWLAGDFPRAVLEKDDRWQRK